MTIIKDDALLVEQQKPKSRKRAFGVSQSVSTSPFTFISNLMRRASARTGKPMDQITEADVKLEDVTKTHKELMD